MRKRNWTALHTSLRLNHLALFGHREYSSDIWLLKRLLNPQSHPILHAILSHWAGRWITFLSVPILIHIFSPISTKDLWRQALKNNCTLFISAVFPPSPRTPNPPCFIVSLALPSSDTISVFLRVCCFLLHLYHMWVSARHIAGA